MYRILCVQVLYFRGEARFRAQDQSSRRGNNCVVKLIFRSLKVQRFVSVSEPAPVVNLQIKFTACGALIRILLPTIFTVEMVKLLPNKQKFVLITEIQVKNIIVPKYFPVMAKESHELVSITNINIQTVVTLFYSYYSCLNNDIIIRRATMAIASFCLSPSV